MTQYTPHTRIPCKAVLLLLGLMLYLPASAQHYNKTNLEKYWRYRERLQRDFLVVSAANTSGTNIPALSLYLSGGSKAVLDWDDANANMSHYIGMLATEYRLLKNNGGNYQQSLTELYYALQALIRLDLTSESRFRADNSIDTEQDTNGWMIRDDVDQSFWNTYHNQLGISDGSEWAFRSRGNPTDVYGPGGLNDYYLESVSQDNIYHLLEALGLVNALVEPETVQLPGQAPAIINFPFLAKAIALRSITMMMHTTPIYLNNKPGNFFQCEMSKPKTWQWLLTPDWALLQQITYEALCSLKSTWYIQNPVTGELAKEGAGDDFDTWLYFCYGLTRAGNKIINPIPFLGTVDLTQKSPANDVLQEEVFFSILDGSYKNEAGVISNVFMKTVGDGIIAFLGSVAGIPPGTIPPGVTGDIVHKLVMDGLYIDPYKVKTLATTGKIGGDDTFWLLRESERNRYLHFQLMYIALHGAPANYTPGSAAYISDQQHYESFLALAPCLGPRSYSLFGGDDYNYEWSANSRLVWPEYRGIENGNTVEYNGLDYMLLHNLYCLAYGQDFRKLTVVEDTDYTSADFENAVDIVGSNVISPNASGAFVASNSVRLIPGFHAQSGSAFSATIAPAPVNYAGVSQLNECTNLPVGARIRSAQTRSTTMPSPEPEQLEDLQTPGLEVYPNPTTGTVVVKLLPNPETLSNATVTITSITGIVVHQQPFSNVGEAIDLSGITEGMYFITVNTSTKTYQTKLMVR